MSREAALDLRAELRVDEVKARARIVSAFEATGGNAVRAARLLGIGHRTIARWLKDPGVAAEVQRIRDKAKRDRERQRAKDGEK